jgi:hypothetical protein
MSQNIVDSLSSKVPSNTKVCKSCNQTQTAQTNPVISTVINIPTWVYVVLAVLIILLILLYLKKEKK